ncbi:MAG: hypothetical protein EB114_06990 [Betaproteobacteria bacterium]|nr:hypothetical protein [Betaproteobacteria bacterium]NCV57891.1 hypothetical protein [Betaproteobacteria bacterium]NCW51695.1 hypothetical protein [Betaproteobacteria bacterium]NCZ28594.1 hypothetical protein [Betaproteobacteria bacterium]NDA24831.1 hypothetical protein [Betaproteobacteria bacterium]
MPIHHEINPDEDDRESLIVMLEPYTHKQFLYLFFDRLERVNQTYEDEVQSLTEENLSQLREAMTRATPGEHLVCLLLRYPNKVMIPYGSSLFAADDLDSIVNGAHQCLDMIRDVNEGELLFRHVHYTYNKLVAFTIGCVCNVKLLEEQLARAQAQLKLR